MKNKIVAVNQKSYHEIGEDNTMRIRELTNVLSSTNIDSRELPPSLVFNIQMCYFNNYDVYVYGDGNDVDVFVRILLNEGLRVCNIIDRDTKKSGELREGVSIISIDEFQKRQSENGCNIFVFVYCTIESEIERAKIRDLMSCVRGIIQIEKWERDDLNGFLSHVSPWYVGRRHYYKTHCNELCETFELLSDDISKETLVEYIRVFVECSIYRLPMAKTVSKYFCEDEALYTHLDDEVWVNIGADIGSTISVFFANQLKAKKIYAVEGCQSFLMLINKNIEMIKRFTSVEIEIIPKFVVGNGKVLSILKSKNERITLINADIEGFELEMLKELSPIIRSDRPVLAICAYHKKEDLVVLPKFLSSTVTNYRFFLRKYDVNLAWDLRLATELVLYAVPEERCLI